MGQHRKLYVHSVHCSVISGPATDFLSAKLAAQRLGSVVPSGVLSAAPHYLSVKPRALNQRLRHCSFLSGFTPTTEDCLVVRLLQEHGFAFDHCGAQPVQLSMNSDATGIGKRWPNLWRWFQHMTAVEQQELMPGKEPGNPVGWNTYLVPPAVPTKNYYHLAPSQVSVDLRNGDE